jgi:hypothetical protein
MSWVESAVAAESTASTKKYPAGADLRAAGPRNHHRNQRGGFVTDELRQLRHWLENYRWQFLDTFIAVTEAMRMREATAKQRLTRELVLLDEFPALRPYVWVGSCRDVNNAAPCVVS